LQKHLSVVSISSAIGFSKQGPLVNVAFSKNSWVIISSCFRETSLQKPVSKPSFWQYLMQASSYSTGTRRKYPTTKSSAKKTNKTKTEKYFESIKSVVFLAY